MLRVGQINVVHTTDRTPLQLDACQYSIVGESFCDGDASWIQVEVAIHFSTGVVKCTSSKLSLAVMQFFASKGKDSLVAAALEASMRSVRLCGANTNAFDLEAHQVHGFILLADLLTAE